MTRRPPFMIEPVTERAALDAYHLLRRSVFVAEQGLFEGNDIDDVDLDPRTVVLVARAGTARWRRGPARAGPDGLESAGGTAAGWPYAARRVPRAPGRCRGRSGPGGLPARRGRRGPAFRGQCADRERALLPRLGWHGRPGARGRPPHVRMRRPTAGSPRWSAHQGPARRAAGRAPPRRASGIRRRRRGTGPGQ